MKRRNMIILSVAATAVTFAGLLIWKLRGAKEWDSLILSVTKQLEAAESDTSRLKTNLVQIISTLKLEELNAQEEADKWKRIGELESDAQMKNVESGFRDGFQLQARALQGIGRELVSVAHLGESLESALTMSRLLQKQIEGAAGVSGRERPRREQINNTKDGIALLETALLREITQLAGIKKRLDQQSSDTQQYGEKVQQLKASLGSSQDRLKQWEKQVVETDSDLNDKRGKHIEDAKSVVVHMGKIFFSLHDVIESQKQVMSVYK